MFLVVQYERQRSDVTKLLINSVCDGRVSLRAEHLKQLGFDLHYLNYIYACFGYDLPKGPLLGCAPSGSYG